ncbi:hypothetical protein Tco_0807523 [Tanacetum coccineum]
MVDDMLKAQSKVIDILCNLELIYPPAFFDIMIHLVIHLPLEAIFGGPIRPRWMYPFKRYMKKLKNYVRNKAKPEGSIAKGYVAEEALTFSSHYFRDVTTKFNRPDRNVDCPPPTCQFQVFKSLCKSIGLRSVIRIDHQELKKVIWYVLHNSPEIDTYRAKFKSEFPDNDMKEAFPGWFGKSSLFDSNLLLGYVKSRRNDPGVMRKQRVITLVVVPSKTPISVNSCVVNGVRLSCTRGDEVAQLKNKRNFVRLVGREMYYRSAENTRDVDAPLDIIDVVDEDDDIPPPPWGRPIPHDLADSDDEDLVNLDIDDGINVMSADVATLGSCISVRNGGCYVVPSSHQHLPQRIVGVCIGQIRGRAPEKTYVGFGRIDGQAFSPGNHTQRGIPGDSDNSPHDPLSPIQHKHKTTTTGRRIPQGKALDSRLRLGLTTPWSASDFTFLSTFPVGNWVMNRLRSGMIPRTVPGRPKINKTRQKAKSYADKDPGSIAALRDMHDGDDAEATGVLGLSTSSRLKEWHGCEDDEQGDDEDDG